MLFRSYLFHEFQSCGLAAPGIPGGPKPVYASPEDLMRKTPGFIDKLFKERLDGYFEGAYRLMEVHFNGINPYMLAVDKHLEHLRRTVEQGSYSDLRRRPRSVNARVLREMLKLRLAELRPRSQKANLPRLRRHTRRVKSRRKLAAYLPT